MRGRFRLELHPAFNEVENSLKVCPTPFIASKLIRHVFVFTLLH